MHIIHEKCFEKGWSKQEIEGLISDPHIFYIKDIENRGFIICRTVLSEAEILTICVLPECRNQGIASKLLAEVLEKTAGTDFFLEVNYKNTAAIKLYEKFGFEVVGLRKKYYNNQDDAFIMRREGV